MNTTGLFSDIVLPTATWYEKNDLNTTDMHPFFHPLTAAIDPVWGARSDWNIFRGLAASLSKHAVGRLGVEKDPVLTPTLPYTPTEVAELHEPREWKTGECNPEPGTQIGSAEWRERGEQRV